jgi:hypothetical protein
VLSNIKTAIAADAKTWREGYDAARHGLDSSCNPYEAEQALTWLASSKA